MSVLIDKKTKVLVQGITGTQASFHVQRAIKYGTNIVAGVVPNKKESKHLGIHLYKTVKDAKKKTGATASMIFVPAKNAKDAIIEAIEAIGVVVLSDPEIGARINTAREMYEALATKIEKASVTNYNKLVKAEEALAALTQDAEDWKVAVDAIAIDGKITVANIEAIDAVEAT